MTKHCIISHFVLVQTFYLLSYLPMFWIPQEALSIYKEAVKKMPHQFAPQSLYNMMGEWRVGLFRHCIISSPNFRGTKKKKTILFCFWKWILIFNDAIVICSWKYMKAHLALLSCVGKNSVVLLVIEHSFVGMKLAWNYIQLSITEKIWQILIFILIFDSCILWSNRLQESQICVRTQRAFACVGL